MTDWTAGYVADIGYTYGYYTELNPLRVRLGNKGTPTYLRNATFPRLHKTPPPR
jgi:hypothetical protein